MPQCSKCNIAAPFHELFRGRCMKCTGEALKATEELLDSLLTDIDKVRQNLKPESAMKALSALRPLYEADWKEVRETEDNRPFPTAPLDKK